MNWLWSDSLMFGSSEKWIPNTSFAFAAGLLFLIALGGFSRTLNTAEVLDSDLFNPQLLKDNSKFQSYTTKKAKYPAIRTFYHAHPHAEKLSGITRLPLFVFVHGLGGCLAQFAPLLGSLVNIAPCFGIELPGCGLSAFSPKNFEAYTVEALASLWKEAIEVACRENGHESVVFICHSMGCSLSALLISEAADATLKLSIPAAGMIAICPKSSPPSEKQTATYRRVLSLPNLVLDAVRYIDRIGGTESSSVRRFVGKTADLDLKKLQQGFNERFPTPVWKRTALGCLPKYDAKGHGHGGFPGQSIWAGIQVPLLLIAGEADVVTKPEEVEAIVSFLRKTGASPIVKEDELTPPSTATNDQSMQQAMVVDDRSFGGKPSMTQTETHHAIVLKTAILPAPAAHALLYDHGTYRTVAGLIEDFLSKHISEHLSLGWQLQTLTTSGKWDVKNLAKWKQVSAVSGPIAGGIFRALKTLREQDEEHTPAVFVKKWADRIFAVIDISHDSPIYDPQILEKGGIQYHKFATVSKVPPTLFEVQEFIALVGRLRKGQKLKPNATDRIESSIGVHCHYGYNRTGFFIVCYLVEKEGYQVQEAIDEFARQKPPGIRHDHFIDTLFVRYCVGLKKAPTINR